MKQEKRLPQCPFNPEHSNVVRNGWIKIRKMNKIIDKDQRYLCRDCNKNFIIDTTSLKEDKQRQALIMYLEGMSFSKIGEFLGVNHETVKNWFKKFNIDLVAIKPLRNLKRNEIKQIDEVHTIAICNYTDDLNDSDDNNILDYSDCDYYKQQYFNSGFIIIEREKKVHISSLKGIPNNTFFLQDKDLLSKEAKKKYKWNELQYGI